MNKIIPTEAFLPSLALVSSIISNKNTMPILSNVRLEIKENSQGKAYAELMTSDGELWLQIKVPIQEGEVGTKACLDAKQLLQGLRNLDNLPFTLELEDNNAKCTYTNGYFSLPYQDVQEFPKPLDNIDNAKSLILDANKVLTALKSVVFATSSDELRLIMNGVHFDFLSDGMVAVATDGVKLAKYKDLSITHNEEANMSFTLPKKSCQALQNLLANIQPTSDIKIVANTNYMTINNSEFKITTRLIDGRFPNYEAVIPKDNDIAISLTKDVFLQSLKRVIPMGNTSSGLVAFGFANNTLSIASKDEDYCKSAEEHIICEYANDALNIGLNGGIVLQVLQSIDAPALELHLKNEARPCLITANTGNSDIEHTILVMPMRL